MKYRETEILVVGGGPAGLSAAIEAADRGAGVLLVDEQKDPGGQLVKQIHKFFGSGRHGAGTRGIDLATQLASKAQKLGVQLLQGMSAVGVFEDSVIFSDRDGSLSRFRASRGIIATGASEKAVAFPGWTLPGVITAGAAQTFVNLYRVVVGQKVLVIGSGNVGLIVAYQLLQAGSEVAGIVEMRPEIGGWGVHASKVRRLGVPILTGMSVKEVRGRDCVEEIVLCTVDQDGTSSGEERIITVDTVCLAVGLSPRIEFPQWLGCRMGFSVSLGGYVPLHNSVMETAVPGWFVAGDVAGVEEASTAIEEGRVAGIAAATSLGYGKGTTCEEEIREIRKSLNELRSGPFGRERKRAKERVVSEYETG